MTKPNAMEQLEAHLKGTTALIFNDANSSTKLEDLRDKLAEIGQQMKNIQDTADAENRALTTEEEEEIESLFASFQHFEGEIARREDIAAVQAKLATPQGRKTDPDDVVAQGDPGASRRRIPAQPRDPNDVGKWGFRSLGEFGIAVKNAARGSGNTNIDPRLIANAPTTVSTEGAGADGGFAVPPDFRTEIMVKVMGEDSLIARTDQLQSSSNSITVPKDETTPWQSSGGVQAYWEGEGDQMNQSKVALEQSTIRLNKLTSLVPVTEELLDDAPALATYLRRKVPEKMDFKLTDAIVNGTGAGMPKGLLQSDAMVTVAKESGQAADSIVFNNIVNMWARLYSRCRSNAIWLINQDIEPQLLSIQFPGTGTAVPAYLPPGGLSASPYGTLLGRPVVPTEACQTLGDNGDIIVADLTQYMTAVKTGGIRQDVSIHLWFDYDTVAFRFIIRVAGQSWWNSAIDPKNGTATKSCIVSLAARA